MWSSIVKGVVEALGTLLLGWIKEEQAKSHEWAAKARKHQIESMKKARALARKTAEKILEARKKKPSIAAWNEGAK